MATYMEKLNEIKDKLYNSKFITLFIIIFIILFIFCSFINFIGNLPILVIVTLLVSYYLYNTSVFHKILNTSFIIIGQ